MAVWQYGFFISNSSNLEGIKVDDIKSGLEKVFGEFLEMRGESYILGDYQTDDCMIILDDDNVSSILCRFDVSILSKEKITALYDFTEANSLSVIDNEKIILDSKEEFSKSVLNSHACKFVNNPIGFLENISKNI